MPAVLHFSLHYPLVQGDDEYESIRSDVTAPIKELLCENKFYLISTRVNGENICPPPTTTTTATSSSAVGRGDFDMEDPYFGNPDYSVLMETPAMVQEMTLGDVRWMSWTVAFHVAQLGQPLIDMADQMGGDNDNEIISDLKVSEVMNDVLQLALQVSIMEGDMDLRMGQRLPGARVSLPGEELSTWAEYGIFSAEDIAEYGNGELPLFSSWGKNPPQHQLMDPPSSASASLPLSSPPQSRSGPSIVAASMYESHSLRRAGIGMFATMLCLWLLLIRLGTRRQKLRQTKYEWQERTRNRNVQLATEDDVSEMLKVGKQALRHGGKSRHTNDSSAMVMIT
jgi:hypothetical protein